MMICQYCESRTVTEVTAQKGGDLQIAGWEGFGVLSITCGKELRSFYARLRGFGGDDPVTRIAGDMTARSYSCTTVGRIEPTINIERARCYSST